MARTEFVTSHPGDQASNDALTRVAEAFGRVALKHPKAGLVGGIQVYESRDAYSSKIGLHYSMIEVDHGTQQIIVHLGNISHEAREKDVPVNEALDEIIHIALDELKPLLT